MKTTVTTLLAVIAVVLVISITGSASHQEAKAQGFEPTVIQVYIGTHNSVGMTYRLWSNGLIEWGMVDVISGPVCNDPNEICGWQVVPDTSPPPFSVQIVRLEANRFMLWRVLSDGNVERNQNQLQGECDNNWCGWVAIPE